jgi:hypothetical protein
MSGQYTKILASDWNPIQTQIASVLGAPSGSVVDLGYNAANRVTSVQTATNTIIRGSEWNTLRNDVNVAYVQQSNAISDLTVRVATNKITQADWAQISARSQTAYNNRLTLGTGQTTLSVGPSYSSSAAWSTQTYYTGSIVWANNAAFRGFWNAGGYITFGGSRSGGTVNSQNAGWTNLLNNMGTITLKAYSMAQSGNTWSGSFQNSSASGVYSSGITSAVSAFVIYDQDTNYTGNYYQIVLSFDNANRFAATTMGFTVYCQDAHAAAGAGPDTVNGTLALNCNIYYPFSNNPSTVSVTASGQS